MMALGQQGLADISVSFLYYTLTALPSAIPSAMLVLSLTM